MGFYWQWGLWHPGSKSFCIVMVIDMVILWKLYRQFMKSRLGSLPLFPSRRYKTKEFSPARTRKNWSGESVAKLYRILHKWTHFCLFASLWFILPWSCFLCGVFFSFSFSFFLSHKTVCVCQLSGVYNFCFLWCVFFLMLSLLWM